jgi:predicted nucleic acid-binding protein
MFITIDVVFHEELMYFSPKAELQGKYQKEYDLITCLDVHDTSVINLDLDINSNFRR